MSILCNSPMVLSFVIAPKSFFQEKPSVRHLLGVPRKGRDERGAPLAELARKISCVALATRSPHCSAAHVPH